jgi:tetratricopeptide (TPR) repeat protein
MVFVTQLYTRYLVLLVTGLLLPGVINLLQAQSENWRDSLRQITLTRQPDSIIAEQIGQKAYQLISVRKLQEADLFIESQFIYALKSKNEDAIASCYYHLTLRLFGKVSTDSIKTLLREGIKHAERGNNNIIKIRLFRTLAQTYETASELADAKKTIEKASFYAERTDNDNERAKTSYTYGLILSRLNLKSEAVQKYYESIAVFERLNDHRSLAYAYNSLATLLMNEKEYANCRKYYEKNLAHCIKNQPSYLPTAYLGMATYYYAVNDVDSALIYYDAAEGAMHEYKDFARLYVVFSNKATIFQVKNNIDSANTYHRKTIELASHISKIGYLGRLYLNFASFQLKTQQLDSAIHSIEQAIEISTEEGDSENLKEAYRLKGQILFEKGDFKDAKAAYEQSILYRDSIALEEKKRELSRLIEEFESNKKQEEIHRLENTRKIQQLELEKKNAIIAGNIQEAKRRQSEIDLLNKENEIKELRLKEQQQTLKQKMLEAATQEQALALSKQREDLQAREVTQQKNAKNVIIGGSVMLIIFLLLVFNQYRISQHRKNENERHQLQHQLSELKIEALRAQMNPHFIFNALNSINRYIIRSDKETASDYLVKFSKLMRLVLENSKSSLVTLRNETDALRLYIEMEQLRFDHKFDYSIEIDPSIDREQTMIPPLVLQPYVENAIWHGLLNKGEEGTVRVKIEKASAHQLFCTVEDDGVGRIKAGEMKSKTLGSNKSFGTEITRERIKLLNGDDRNFRIVDLYDAHKQPAGTRVEITLHTEVRTAA